VQAPWIVVDVMVVFVRCACVCLLMPSKLGGGGGGGGGTKVDDEAALRGLHIDPSAVQVDL